MKWLDHQDATVNKRIDLYTKLLKQKQDALRNPKEDVQTDIKLQRQINEINDYILLENLSKNRLLNYLSDINGMIRTVIYIIAIFFAFIYVRDASLPLLQREDLLYFKDPIFDIHNIKSFHTISVVLILFSSPALIALSFYPLFDNKFFKNEDILSAYIYIFIMYLFYYFTLDSEFLRNNKTIFLPLIMMNTIAIIISLIEPIIVSLIKYFFVNSSKKIFKKILYSIFIMNLILSVYMIYNENFIKIFIFFTISLHVPIIMALYVNACFIGNKT